MIERTIHFSRVNAMKVDAMQVVGGIDQSDADPIAFTRANGWAGDAPVVDPGWVADAGCDLNRFGLSDECILAQCLAVWQAAYRAIVEVGQNVRRINPFAT
jgi:hypothetical protein